MREIKFRAWDKKNKEIVKPSGVYGNQQYWQIESGNVQYWGIFDGSKRSNNRICGNADDSGILMQYTGLKDKNGVEIYEGDIVKDEVGVGVVSFINSGKYNVVGYAIKYNDEKFVFLFSEMKYEIIGNIYEHPELLEAK